MTGRPLQRYRTCIQWWTGNIRAVRQVDHIGGPPDCRGSDISCTPRLLTRVFPARAGGGCSAASPAAGWCGQMSGPLDVRQSNMQKCSGVVLCGPEPARFQTSGAGGGHGDIVLPHRLCGVL